MNSLYLNEFTLGFLAQLILTVMLTVYLLSLRNKTTATWWLLLFFAGLTAYAAVSFYKEASLGIGSFYAAHGQVVLIVLAMVPMLQLAYRYPKDPRAAGPVGQARGEATAVLVISLLAVLVSLSWAVYQFLQIKPGGAPTTSTTFADYWLAVACLWTLIAFWRRSVAFSRREAPSDPLTRHLFQPSGRPARAAFAFLVSSAAAVAVIALLLISASLIKEGRTLHSLAPSAGVLIAEFLFALAYFSYAPENTSFLVKLVGISLVTVLLALTPVATFVAADFKESLRLETSISEPQTLHFEARQDGGYQVTTLPLQFAESTGEPAPPGVYALPFEFPFFGESQREARLYRGVVSFNDWNSLALQYNLVPAIVLMRTNTLDAATLSINPQPDAFTVTWMLAGNGQDVEPVEIQARLYPDGSFDLNLRELGSLAPRQTGFQRGNGRQDTAVLDLTSQYSNQLAGANGMMAPASNDYQPQLHQQLLPLAYLLVVASLLTLLLFPLFYNVLLIKPLRALTAGVRQVDRGDLPVQVPVSYQDEIGVITDAFNRMTTSVWESDQHLESLVAARTMELAASESRFRELFENMTSGVAVFEPIDAAGDYLLRDLNQAGARIEKVTRDESVGQPISQRLAGEELAGVLELLNRAGHSDANTPLEPVLMQRPNGAWREIVAYRLPTGEIVLVFDDVTERLQSQAREQRLAALEERERIGRELHDDLGQVLGFISAQSQAALALVDKGDNARARAALEQLTREAQIAHGEVRQYILGIRSEQAPSVARAFFVTLDEYLADLYDRYGMAVQLSLPDSWQRSPLTPDVETQVLRIVQEALTNVRKHAQRPEARLQFFDQGDWVQVVIADDGPGFDPDALGQDDLPHFGRTIMRERAEQINGRVEIRSSQQGGTEVIVLVPRAITTPDRFPAGVRVLLADDHGLYLEGLRNLLATRGYQVVGVASDGIEAQEQAAALRPDLILMDVHMPRCDGLEATRKIKAEFPEIKIVMLTVAAEGEVLFDALKAGASGYLLKSLDGDDFFRLLTDVLAGNTALSPALANRMLTEFAGRGAEPERAEESPALTARQLEVLALVAAGMSNLEIAAALHITERTVKYHVSEILSRLQLRNRYELARYAQEQGLVENS